MVAHRIFKSVSHQNGFTLVEALVGVAGVTLALMALLNFLSLAGKGSNQMAMEAKLSAQLSALQLTLSEPASCTPYFQGLALTNSATPVALAKPFTFPGKAEPLFAPGVDSGGWTTDSITLNQIRETSAGSKRWSTDLQITVSMTAADTSQGPTSRVRHIPLVLETDAGGLVQKCFVRSTADMIQTTCSALGGTLNSEIPPRCLIADCQEGEFATGVNASGQITCRKMTDLIAAQIVSIGVCPDGMVLSGFDSVTGLKICTLKTERALPPEVKPPGPNSCANAQLGPNPPPGYTPDKGEVVVACDTICSDTQRSSYGGFYCDAGTWFPSWGNISGLNVVCSKCGMPCDPGVIKGQVGSWCIKGEISVPSAPDGREIRSNDICDCNDCTKTASMGVACKDGRWDIWFWTEW